MEALLVAQIHRSITYMFGCDVQVACIEAAFPFALPETSCIVDTLLNTPLSQMSRSLTPSCHPATAPDAQSVVVGGIPRDRVFGSVLMMRTLQFSHIRQGNRNETENHSRPVSIQQIHSHPDPMS